MTTTTAMTVPEPVLLVTLGIDVQLRYLASLMMGWAPDGEAWVLEWETVECDPRDPAMLPQFVQGLDALRLPHPTAELPIHFLGIDSGFITDLVYRAVNAAPRRSGRKWVFATKGVGGREGEPIVLPIRDERDGSGRRGPRPLPINADGAKAEVMAALQVPKGGHGYWHLPKRVGEDFVNQLTSEEQRPKYDRDGVLVGTEWKKKSADARNEGLDCAVINLALYHQARPRDWLHLLRQRHGDEAGTAAFLRFFPEHRPSSSAPAPPPRPTQGWLQRWAR